MTALFPSRVDEELNERALKVLAADKKNEADVGMDGAWTGHPDQNETAVAQFPAPNQIEVRKPDLEAKPNLRPIPERDWKTYFGRNTRRRSDGDSLSQRRFKRQRRVAA